MKLIELDKVEMLIAEYKYERISIQTLQKSIQSLPQIDIEDLRKSILKEVEEEIEKMIEEYENEQKRISKWSSLHYDLSMYIKTLQELLQKFKS